MIEEKTMWGVNHFFEIEERSVIVKGEDVLLSKNPNDENDEYVKGTYYFLKFFDSEDLAKKWIETNLNTVRDTIPIVARFIKQMDEYPAYLKKLGITKEAYLGCYGKKRKDNSSDCYYRERSYAERLETFIQSRMININGDMIPVDQVREVKWYGLEEADEYDQKEWKAVLTTTNGDEYSTGDGNDVRLIWAVFGHCRGLWYIDNDIDYDKEEE